MRSVCTFEIRLDDSEHWEQVSSPHLISTGNFSSLAGNATHSLDLRASDAAGNKCEPVRQTWDATTFLRPETQLLTGPVSPSASRRAVFLLGGARRFDYAHTRPTDDGASGAAAANASSSTGWVQNVSTLLVLSGLDEVGRVGPTIAWEPV